jgi:2-alkenal reductase
MHHNHRSPFIILISILILTSLACGGLSVLSSPEGENPVVETSIDEQQIVAQAVATINAQIPVVAPAATVESSPPIVDEVPAAILSTDLEETLVSLYEQVNPAVVNIFVLDNRNIEIGGGSGFVYDSDGHIVTNNHVVSGAAGLEVVFPSGIRSKAEIVGTDIDSDLAVIKVGTLPDGVRPVPLGDSRTVRVGQFVVAIGNPFGQSGSYSLGIVSGLGRSLRSDRVAAGGGQYTLPQVIQTDAAINPGNSGGPLLNLAGEVIGVNSAIRTSTGTNSGVGFSIPVNAVKRITPALITEGVYQYPFMGIRLSNLDLESQEQFNLPQVTGAFVAGVSPNTPADRAGIRSAQVDPVTGEVTASGDLIIAVDGQPITNSDDLIAYLVFETEVGQTINLRVIRDGDQISVPLVLDQRP